MLSYPCIPTFTISMDRRCQRSKNIVDIGHGRPKNSKNRCQKCQKKIQKIYIEKNLANSFHFKHLLELILPK